jgi:hypothetical protein
MGTVYLKGTYHFLTGKNHSFKGASLGIILNSKAFQVKCRDLPLIPDTIVEKCREITFNLGSGKGKSHSSKGASHSFKGTSLGIALNTEVFLEKSRVLVLITVTIVKKYRSGKGKNHLSWPWC